MQRPRGALALLFGVPAIVVMPRAVGVLNAHVPCEPRSEGGNDTGTLAGWTSLYSGLVITLDSGARTREAASRGAGMSAYEEFFADEEADARAPSPAVLVYGCGEVVFAGARIPVDAGRLEAADGVHVQVFDDHQNPPIGLRAQLVQVCNHLHPAPIAAETSFGLNPDK